MDLLERFVAQLNALQAVWMPFALAVGIVGFVIWKIVQWQHGVRITNLTSQLELYREASSISAAASETAVPKRADAPVHPAAESPAAPTGRKSPRSTDLVQEAGGRVFVDADVTLSTLKKLIGNKTALAANEAAEAYIGKWMRVSGVVFNVTPSGRKLIVTMFDEEIHKMPLINLFFDDHAQPVRELEKGQHINTIGRLKSVQNLSITFSDCELVP